MSNVDKLRVGEIMHFDGVALRARGDVFNVVFGADPSVKRSRWLFRHGEQLVTHCGQSIMCMLVIPQGLKPPDQATRAEETAGYARMGSNLRRVVVVAEGSGFHISMVRLVISTYIAVSGKGKFLSFAKDVNEGIARLQECATPLTPSPKQILADIAEMRSACVPDALQMSSMR